MTQISVSRERKKKCRRPTVLTPDIARRMIAIQAENFGKLLYRKLCGKMKLEDLEFTGNTIFRWCKALGINK